MPLRMKNEDIASNEQIFNATMDYVGEHINLPAKLLIDMLVALRSTNSEAIDCGGANTSIGLVSCKNMHTV